LHARAPTNKREAHSIGAGRGPLSVRAPLHRWPPQGSRGIGRTAMATPDLAVRIRNTQASDFDGIGDLCRRVYPETSPWSPEQLASHLRVFPEGQFVAVAGDEERVVAMSASLVIAWDHYDMFDDWDEFTAHGTLTNHDREHGQTLYGVEAIVDPALQGHGLGHKIVQTQKGVTERLRLRRMRGGARLRDYHHHAREMTAPDYVVAVVHGQLVDHTLTFHLHEGFHVLAVVPHYLSDDSETLGYAALVEWLNPETIEPHHYAARPTGYLHRDVIRQQQP
jgi:ribosomal protein S18 acetylase RimI-like enzyme